MFTRWTFVRRKTKYLKMSVINALDFDNEVFRVFITYGGLLLLKMLLMSMLTGTQRFRKGVSAIR